MPSSKQRYIFSSISNPGGSNTWQSYYKASNAIELGDLLVKLSVACFFALRGATKENINDKP